MFKNIFSQNFLISDKPTASSVINNYQVLAQQKAHIHRNKLKFILFCRLEQKLSQLFYYSKNPFTLVAFCQKRAFFGHFGDFQAEYRAKLAPSYSTWQHAFLSTAIAFYDIFGQASAEIKIRRAFGGESSTYFGFLVFFITIIFSFPFPPFLTFLLQWLTFYWACFQFKNFCKSLIETGNFNFTME